MSLLLGKGLRAIVQGITGRAGRYHTQISQDYAPCFVGGVSPGKGGRKPFWRAFIKVEMTGENRQA